MVITAVAAVAAATIAWLWGTRRRVAPNLFDLVVVVLVSLTAAITVSGPVV